MLNTSLVALLSVAAIVAAVPVPPKADTTNTNTVENFSCRCPQSDYADLTMEVCETLERNYPRIKKVRVPIMLSNGYCKYLEREIVRSGPRSVGQIVRKAEDFIEQSSLDEELQISDPDFVDNEIPEEGKTNFSKLRLKDDDEILEASVKKQKEIWVEDETIEGGPIQPVKKHKFFGTPKAADQGDF